MDTSKLKDRIQSYLEDSKKIISEYPQMDEENTKRKLTEPLLKILGWDLVFDAELEYSIKMANTKGSVDYALSTDSSVSLLVESKGLYKDIDSEDVQQLESYMKLSDVKWGVLTDGENIRIYRLQYKNNESKIRKIRELGLDELEQNTEAIKLISKEFIKSGRSNEVADRRLSIQESKKTLENNREDIANQIEETIGKYTNDSVSKIIRKISKGAVEQAIDEIEEEIEELGKYEEDESRSSATEDNRTPSPTEIQNKTPVSFKGEEVDLDDNITARQNLIEVLNYMFSEGYVSVAEDVPLKRGRKRYLINEEPFDSEGDRMIDEKQLKNDLYVETNHSSKDIQNIIEELVGVKDTSA